MGRVETERSAVRGGVRRRLVSIQAAFRDPGSLVSRVALPIRRGGKGYSRPHPLRLVPVGGAPTLDLLIELNRPTRRFRSIACPPGGRWANAGGGILAPRRQGRTFQRAPSARLWPPLRQFVTLSGRWECLVGGVAHSRVLAPPRYDADLSVRRLVKSPIDPRDLRRRGCASSGSASECPLG